MGSGDGETKYNNMTNPNPNKKLPLSVDSDSDQNVDESSNSAVSARDDWPRFIILEPTENDRPLARLAPFAIHKSIMGIAGTVKDTKKLRSGQILVECGKKAHADNLPLRWRGVGMKASPHRSLNSSKGVIRTRELGDLEEEEITEELRPQGVLNVRRIIIKRGGETIKTGTYILTFSRPTPPKKLRVGYLSVAVDLFIPNPLRCFQC